MNCAACAQSVLSLENQCSQCGLLYKEPIERADYYLEEIHHWMEFTRLIEEKKLSLKSLKTLHSLDSEEFWIQFLDKMSQWPSEWLIQLLENPQSSPIQETTNVQCLLICLAFANDVKSHYWLSIYISQLPTALKMTLIHQLKWAPSHFLEKKIICFQNVMSNSTHFVKKCLSKTLHCFYHANHYSKLPIKTFYLETISEDEFMSDFKQWTRSNETNEFLYCHYPFLIPLSIKLKLLTFDIFGNESPQSNSNLELTTESMEAQLKGYLTRKDGRKIPLNILLDGNVISSQNLLSALCQIWIEKRLLKSQSNGYWFDENCTLFEPMELFGMLIGWSIIHGIPFPIPLSKSIFLSIMNVPPDLEELKEVDSETFTKLSSLMAYNGMDLQYRFNLFFAIEEHELVNNGRFIPVTQRNKEEFIQKYLFYQCRNKVKDSIQACRHGFLYTMGGNASTLFHWNEF